MDKHEAFRRECAEEVARQGADAELGKSSREWMNRSLSSRYSYHFEWMGRPIIQYPQDMVAMQEIIWRVQPDLILEAGIAHGGSLIFSAAMLELNAACGGPADARVLGVDIDIRSHNREAIEAHPMSRRIDMIQASSIESDTIAQVHAAVAGRRNILVSLDSNHTHDHVLAELEAYAPLTAVGSYCVVFDTVVEDSPAELSADRPWGPGDNPKTAVWKYLESHPEFEIDTAMDDKLLLSVAPQGFLKRIA